jgi:hypothetical protein
MKKLSVTLMAGKCRPAGRGEGAVSRISRVAAAVLTALAPVAQGCAQAPGLAHYNINARFDLKASAIQGNVTITLPPAEVGQSTAFVLSDRIELRKAYGSSGAHVTVEPTEQPFKGLRKITFTFDRAPTRPVVLKFVYAGKLGAEEALRIDPSQGIELSMEDMWAPVRPNFGLLFTADANLSGIPPNEVAVAQGKVSRRGDHVFIHRTFADIDMPFTALTGLKVARSGDAELYARNPDGPLQSALRRNSGAIVAFYTRLFGPPPAQSLPERVLVLPRQGAAFARRAYVSLGDPTEELKKLGSQEEWKLVATTAHEFAHAWWWRADPLTENNWLNESLAEYSSLRFTELEAGAEALKYRLDRKVEPASKAGPIIGHGRPSKFASYQKGPLLLFELDRQIGRERMDSFLAALGRDPPRTTEEFLAILGHSAGADVAREFEAKLRAP